MKDWKEIERIFHLVLREEPGRREVLLEEECADDLALKQEVRNLLLSYEDATDFLEKPALQSGVSPGVDQHQSEKKEDSPLPKGFPFREDTPLPVANSDRYRIERKLGQGGMGEVFLAEDTVLGRKVALKFLPQLLEENRLARKRFLREARTIAALDHPFICHINEVAVTEDGRDFIVMEYIEGLTLRERLSESVIPLQEVLQIASEVAEALEKAHKAGIIHRDLKPSNIMFTREGHVKVLDFGLAKHFIKKVGGLTSGLTSEGVTVGTLAYMAPEQIRSEELDPRTDIFALGIVLFEMLTQVHPFRRETAMLTVGAILNEDPPRLLRAGKSVPRAIRSIVEKMLNKNRENRQQSISEVKSSLDEAVDSLRNTPAELWRRVRLSIPWKQVIPWALIPLAAAGGILVTKWFSKDARSISNVTSIRAEIGLPDGQGLNHWFRDGLALSPDGRTLVFVAGPTGQPFQHQELWRPNDGRIYLRRMDQLELTPVPGTENGFQPFFSPDGNWIGFTQFDSRTGKYFLKRAPLDGGEAITLCETELPFGASWGEEGIVFAGEVGGLQRIQSSGGIPEEITHPDKEFLEVGHRHPRHLPGNKGLLYVSVGDPNPNWSRSKIFVYSDTLTEPKMLIEGGSDARYLQSGHIVFARLGQLWAVAFDLEKLETVGTPVRVLEGVSHSIFTGGEWQETGIAQFTVSNDGLLAYIPGSVFGEPKHSVVWVDRKGREEPLNIEPRKWARVRVSRDGKHALLAHWYLPGGLWVYDIQRGISRLQTFRGPTSIAVWGPGPGQFTVDADTQGFTVKGVDTGPGEYLRLPDHAEKGTSFIPGEWSYDGKWLMGVSFPGPADILAVSAEGKSRPFLQTTLREEFPAFSPDGKWLAYAVFEMDRYQVYVRPFPGPGPAIRISTDFGWAPVWSADGHEIYYRIGGRFLSVQIQVDGDRLTASDPVELFSGPYPGASPIRSYDVSPDGRFLMIKTMAESGWTEIFDEAFSDHIRIKQNWFQELGTIVPR